jgi:hypothetical protein
MEHPYPSCNTRVRFVHTRGEQMSTLPVGYRTRIAQACHPYPSLSHPPPPPPLATP